MTIDMTKGPVIPSMLRFAAPMVAGNLLQQCYNIADTLIVGKFLGPNALAAVGSSFTLMTFLTSILLGLCMGSGTLFSIRFGQRDPQALAESVRTSFLMIASFTVVLNGVAFLFLRGLQGFMQVPSVVWPMMREYLAVIFCGIAATFFYNFFASLLRSVGNSGTPLIFLAVSAVLNIVLDLWFVVGMDLGVAGAAWATVIAQYVSGVGIALYSVLCLPCLKTKLPGFRLRWDRMKELASFSLLTCVQQSVMNLGILLVQGIVNGFGPAVMAAFAAAVKIDAFAYMPVQDFGNAFSTYIAQNYGASEKGRIRTGFRGALIATLAFGGAVSLGVCLFAKSLMLIFVEPTEATIIAAGVQYLRIEGAFYWGIGCLFLLYGLYRALGRPGMSVVLTVISLGLRALLSYFLSGIPAVGVLGIWWSVPTGWLLADGVGLGWYLFRRKKLLPAGPNDGAG